MFNFRTNAWQGQNIQWLGERAVVAWLWQNRNKTEKATRV